MSVDPQLLAPPPQEINTLPETWTVPAQVRVGPLKNSLNSQLDAALDGVAKELARRGSTLERKRESGDEIRLALTGDTAAGDRQREAYQLTVAETGIELTAHAAVGLFRGLTTLVQWLRLHPGDGPDAIQGVHVVDWPDVVHRGLMLDVSRNRVPTMAQLYALVDMMAELKLNQLQLYFEHTFAYAGHETVWRDASPLRAEEVRRLESYARRRCIELVPNQNSFGHFHRWLVHEPYRQLAECPDGIDHPFSPTPEPFSLCPTDPRSLDLLRNLYDQLLPQFTSPLFNVGFDETLDLGRCRSRKACEEHGTGRVYLDFLRRVQSLAAQHGRRILFWADVVLAEPDIVPDLPKDATAMVWGYEADHDFKAPLEKLRGAGLEAYLCPGTASWNSFTGRTEAARINLANAARASDGAAGYLITDWGDFGHLQPAPASWPAYVLGAAFSWKRLAAVAPEAFPLAEVLDRHILRDPAGLAGQALLDLGDAQAATGIAARNGSPLFFAWMFAAKSSDERRGVGFSDGGLDAAQTRLADAMSALRRSQMQRADADAIRSEMQWASDAVGLGAGLARARLGVGEDAPVESIGAVARRRLNARLNELIERLPPIWLQRSRPGGLRASISLFSSPGLRLS